MQYEVLVGDCLDSLKELPDESVQVCVTSPPYYNLRDYGTANWEGGDPDCDHLGPPKQTQAGFNERYFSREAKDSNKQAELRMPYVGTCGKCGAKRVDKQIGLEESLGEYIQSLVNVFREVKRVLRPDGTLWLNLGDSYAGSGKGRNANGVANVDPDSKQATSQGTIEGHLTKSNTELAPKNLMGVPWRVAFALQDDGWILRSEVIWHKPNPMPSPVKDRPTSSHEHIFLFAKSGKYYYDSDAIREPIKSDTPQAKRDIKRMQAGRKEFDGERKKHQDSKQQNAFIAGNPAKGRNKRDVWSVTTKPFKGAHFAVYPPDLIEPCILASTSEKGACADCGTPWTRVTERVRIKRNELDPSDPRYRPNTYDGAYDKINGRGDAGYTQITEKGWQPGCECHGKLVRKEVIIPPKLTLEELAKTTWSVDKDGNYTGQDSKDYKGNNVQSASDVKRRIIEGKTKPKVKKQLVYESDLPLDEHPIKPCVVLDPFGGSGTTAAVANAFRRDAILCELNPEYAKIIPTRIEYLSERYTKDRGKKILTLLRDSNKSLSEVIKLAKERKK